MIAGIVAAFCVIFIPIFVTLVVTLIQTTKISKRIDSEGFKEFKELHKDSSITEKEWKTINRALARLK